MTKFQSERIKQLTPLIKSIRERCLDCSAGSSYEVSMCVCDDCALYPYRMGLNSNKSKTTNKKRGSVVETTAVAGDEDGE